MQHSIVFKQKDTYASFPLLKYINGILTIGFFTAPVPDHMGLFNWKVMRSLDEGETWGYKFSNPPYDWPAVSARERYDRFTTVLPDGTEIATGSFGFRFMKSFIDGKKTIHKSQHLFLRSSTDGWETIKERAWKVPNADVVCTFPRVLEINNRWETLTEGQHFASKALILIPAYAGLKNGLNRALVWRSIDYGKNWKLYNMFPNEMNANEIAFVNTERGVLAHVRSDTCPYIMESWSQDGITWTYPTNLCNNNSLDIIGGPSHLLRLKDRRILDSYGYRLRGMGVRTIISEDEGMSWNKPIILRGDGGYPSSLHKRRWRNRFRLPHAGNDTGYPVSVELEDGTILTAYYLTGKDRITAIYMTKWRI